MTVYMFLDKSLCPIISVYITHVEGGLSLSLTIGCGSRLADYTIVLQQRTKTCYAFAYKNISLLHKVIWKIFKLVVVFKRSSEEVNEQTFLHQADWYIEQLITRRQSLTYDSIRYNTHKTLTIVIDVPA